MPMYTHVCASCGGTVDVLRSVDDYQVPPTKDECPVCPQCGTDKPDWTKLVNVSTKRWRFCDSKGG
jgi:predicted nucleic acid-binding Zn ribbon protein